MKILIPMYYFESGSITTNEGLQSHFELSGSDLMPKVSPSGTLGLFDVDENDDIRAAGNWYMVDSYFEHNGAGDIVPREDITTALFENLILSMSVATQSSFEPRKAFTGDLGEYGKIKDFLTMQYPYTSVGTQGLLIKGETSGITLYEYTGSNRGGFNLITPSTVYGKTTLTLTEYPNDSLWKFYAVSGSTNDYENIFNVAHGILYDIGSGHRMEQQSYNYSYPQSKTRHSFLGNVNWSGWFNTKVRRTHTLELKSVNESTKLVLLDIFRLGKGGLPIWFIDDETDNSTWMFVSIPKINITEPYAKLFNITMEMREF